MSAPNSKKNAWELAEDLLPKHVFGKASSLLIKDEDTMRFILEKLQVMTLRFEGLSEEYHQLQEEYSKAILPAGIYGQVESCLEYNRNIGQESLHIEWRPEPFRSTLNIPTQLKPGDYPNLLNASVKVFKDSCSSYLEKETMKALLPLLQRH